MRVGWAEAGGVEFTLHAVVVDDNELAELNQHNGTEYYLPNPTLPWPIGPTRGTKTVTRAVGSNC